MKTIIVLLLASFSLALISCEKEPEVQIQKESVSDLSVQNREDAVKDKMWD